MGRPHLTPESIVRRLHADLAALEPVERERCHRMILCDVVEQLHGGKVLEIAQVVGQLERAAQEERDKNSRRSRREDAERNNKIRGAAGRGLQPGQIAKLLGYSVASVRGVLTRARKK